MLTDPEAGDERPMRFGPRCADLHETQLRDAPEDMRKDLEQNVEPFAWEGASHVE